MNLYSPNWYLCRHSFLSPLKCTVLVAFLEHIFFPLSFIYCSTVFNDFMSDIEKPPLSRFFSSSEYLWNSFHNLKSQQFSKIFLWEWIYVNTALGVTGLFLSVIQISLYFWSFTLKCAFEYFFFPVCSLGEGGIFSCILIYILYWLFWLRLLLFILFHEQ